MSTCPISSLRNVLKSLNPSVPKSNSIGRFERIGIDESGFISILEKLHPHGLSVGKNQNRMNRWNLSNVGTRVGNFILQEVRKIDNHIPEWPVTCFIGNATLTLDVLFRQIFELTTLEDVNKALPHLKAILRSKSLFYPGIEKIVRDDFPHKVDNILNANVSKDFTLCPAFHLMDKVFDAIMPLYITEWKRRKK